MPNRAHWIQFQTWGYVCEGCGKTSRARFGKDRPPKVCQHCSSPIEFEDEELVRDPTTSDVQNNSETVIAEQPEIPTPPIVQLIIMEQEKQRLLVEHPELQTIEDVKETLKKYQPILALEDQGIAEADITLAPSEEPILLRDVSASQAISEPEHRYLTDEEMLAKYNMVRKNGRWVELEQPKKKLFGLF